MVSAQIFLLVEPELIHSFFNGGNDTITDFNFTDGDLIDVETQYFTIQQTGNDTILDFDTGGQITLIGIEQADIQMDWFM